MLQFVTILKALVEVALFALIGQAILYVFAGASRERNAVYKIFAYATKPVWKFTRIITPRVIVDQHVGLVSFFLLAVIWVVLVIAKIYFHVQIKAAGT